MTALVGADEENRNPILEAIITAVYLHNFPFVISFIIIKFINIRFKMLRYYFISWLII